MNTRSQPVGVENTICQIGCNSNNRYRVGFFIVKLFEGYPHNIVIQLIAVRILKAPPEDKKTKNADNNTLIHILSP